MERVTKEEWISIISLLLTVVISVFNNDTNKQVIIPIMVLLVIVSIVLIVYNRTKANKNLSNTAVITKSRRYTKFLKRLVKENGKILNKYYNTRGFKKFEKSYKKVLNNISGKNKNEEDKIKTIISNYKIEYSEVGKITINEYYLKKSYKKLTKISKISKRVLKYCSHEQANEIHNIISKNLNDLRRILLYLEQHQLRIRLGNYIVKYSFDLFEKIDSYLDDIGWTQILLGDNNKGVESVKKGLYLIDNYLFGEQLYTFNYKTDYDKIEKKYNLLFQRINAKSLEEQKIYYKLLMLRARALRHLGTTYYTYKTMKDRVPDFLNEALTLICDNPYFKSYYYDQGNDSNKKKYVGMKMGIEYNLLYYTLMSNKNLNDEFYQNLYKDIIKMLEELKYYEQKDNIYDKHRYLKLLSFKTQIYNEIKNKTFKEKFENEIDKDLKKIENELNSNIYFDEAIETYLHEKIEKMYDDVSKVFRK